MARELSAVARGASATVSSFIPPWLMAIVLVAASLCILSLSVFLCGRSSHTEGRDGKPKKKPAAAKAKGAKASRAASSGSRDVHGAAYLAGVTAGQSSSGCGGGGGGGGGQGSCCGGGGGGGCGGGGGGGCGGC